MSNFQLNIPKTIVVGYNERKDTYTGKLAYVIYKDNKGVLRKESSWNSWRNKEMGSNEYENVPTSGFVLNKKVGDYKSSWNHRMAHIRVYDPRGFEFEISVDNLLYILVECTSVKGKGLEGEFVYSWDGKDIVLLPVGSEDYKNSAEFTNMQTKKVGKDMIKEGCVYLNKDMKKVMYLGRHDVFEFDPYNYRQSHTKYEYVHKNAGKKHIFVFVDAIGKEVTIDDKSYYNDISFYFNNKYWIQTGFTKIADVVSTDIDPSFASEYDMFKQSLIGCQCDKLEETAHVIDEESLKSLFNRNNYKLFITKENGVYKLENICCRDYYNNNLLKKDINEIHLEINYDHKYTFSVEGSTINFNSEYAYDRNSMYYYQRQAAKAIKADYLIGKTHYSYQLVNKYGKIIKIHI